MRNGPNTDTGPDDNEGEVLIDLPEEFRKSFGSISGLAPLIRVNLAPGNMADETRAHAGDRGSRTACPRGSRRAAHRQSLRAAADPRQRPRASGLCRASGASGERSAGSVRDGGGV